MESLLMLTQLIVAFLNTYGEMLLFTIGYILTFILLHRLLRFFGNECQKSLDLIYKLQNYINENSLNSPVILSNPGFSLEYCEPNKPVSGFGFGPFKWPLIKLYAAFELEYLDTNNNSIVTLSKTIEGKIIKHLDSDDTTKRCNIEFINPDSYNVESFQTRVSYHDYNEGDTILLRYCLGFPDNAIPLEDYQFRYMSRRILKIRKQYNLKISSYFAIINRFGWIAFSVATILFFFLSAYVSGIVTVLIGITFEELLK